MVMSLEQEAFADVLKSLHKLFLIETTDLFFSSILEVHGQLGLVPSKEQYECYESKHDLIHAGLDRWLESLVVVCQKYVRDITQIVPSYPQHITGDRAHWARLQIEDLLGRELRQKLSLEEFAQEAHESTRKRRLKLQDPNAAQLTVQSKVGGWFRRVCDGLPDFDHSESGFHEPWTAPAYCEEISWMRLQIKRHGSCPERLTAEGTDHVIWRAETQFGTRLEHVLNVAEDQSRIFLASQPVGAYQHAESAKAAEEAQLTPEITTVDAQNGNGAGQSLAVAKRQQSRKRSDQEDADRRQQSNMLPMNARANKPGRPRKDDDRKRVNELKDQGKTWNQIMQTINRETGQNKSKDAYRRLGGPSK
jgi:hypothetical protein